MVLILRVASGRGLLSRRMVRASIPLRFVVGTRVRFLMLRSRVRRLGRRMRMVLLRCRIVFVSRFSVALRVMIGRAMSTMILLLFTKSLRVVLILMWYRITRYGRRRWGTRFWFVVARRRVSMRMRVRFTSRLLLLLRWWRTLFRRQGRWRYDLFRLTWRRRRVRCLNLTLFMMLLRWFVLMRRWVKLV